jgi:hypothetical protein
MATDATPLVEHETVLHGELWPDHNRGRARSQHRPAGAAGVAAGESLDFSRRALRTLGALWDCCALLRPRSAFCLVRLTVRIDREFGGVRLPNTGFAQGGLAL